MIKLSEPWQKRVQLRLGALALLGLLAVMMPAAEGLYWRFGLAAHFQMQLFLGVLCLAALALLLRCWWALAGSGVLVAITFWPLMPLYLDTSQHTEKATFSVGAMNVLTRNRDHDAVLNAVRAREPDILLVMETDRNWLAQLETLRDLYPFILAEPRRDNFGIALLSKFEPTKAEIRTFGEADVPSVVAWYEIDGRRLLFVGTHPVPPSSAEAVRLRDGQMEEVAAFLRRRPPGWNTILAGDLNNTPFSASFRNLLARTRLRDTAEGFGYQPTWPVEMPWFWIPIDHILVSNKIRVADRSVGPAVGSDHFPVWAELGFAPSPSR
ncbi:MAG: endonuclease/exonuclease/phosphatase family protein [Verrucomicrobiota bacterium]